MAKFAAPKGIERRYTTQLRKVARIVAGIVAAYADGAKLRDRMALQAALESYSKALAPWAEKTVYEMVQSVERYNRAAWQAQASKMGAGYKKMFEQSATGAVAKMLHDRQVTLIKSLPIEAGIRAQKIAQEAAIGGKRIDEAAAEIASTEQVTLSRATLIARTETAKANAAITQARAQYAGVTHYIWRTAEDGDVRSTHADLEGQIFRYDSPPDIPGEGRHNPGEIWNCRCWSEPIFKNIE